MPNQQSAISENRLRADIAKMLHTQSAGIVAGSVFKLLMGMLACLFAGVVVASIICFILFQLIGRTLIGFSGWFWGFILLLVPIIIMAERKSRPDYLTDTLLGMDSEPSSVGEHKLERFGIQVAVWSSFISWGPRALIDGFRGLRRSMSGRQDAVFNRAALLVIDLSTSQTRIDVKSLIHPPEDMNTFGQAVELLDMHNLIGKSSDGTSFWLDSTFRKKLVWMMPGRV